MSSAGWAAFDSRGGAEWLRAYIEKTTKRKVNMNNVNYTMLTDKELVRAVDNKPDATSLERLLVERLDGVLQALDVVQKEMEKVQKELENAYD